MKDIYERVFDIEDLVNPKRKEDDPKNWTKFFALAAAVTTLLSIASFAFSYVGIARFTGVSPPDIGSPAACANASYIPLPVVVVFSAVSMFDTIVILMSALLLLYPHCRPVTNAIPQLIKHKEKALEIQRRYSSYVLSLLVFQILFDGVSASVAAFYSNCWRSQFLPFFCLQFIEVFFDFLSLWAFIGLQVNSFTNKEYDPKVDGPPPGSEASKTNGSKTDESETKGSKTDGSKSATGITVIDPAATTPGCCGKFWITVFWIITHPAFALVLLVPHFCLYVIFLVIDLITLWDSELLTKSPLVQAAVVAFGGINYFNICLVAILFIFVIAGALSTQDSVKPWKMYLTDRSRLLFAALFYLIFIDSVALALDLAQKNDNSNSLRQWEFIGDSVLLGIDFLEIILFPFIFQRLIGTNPFSASLPTW